jgi:four helix bundle protein
MADDVNYVAVDGSRNKHANTKKKTEDNYMAEPIRSFRDLRVYKGMFDLQQAIFQVTKAWPSEEKYALTDQVRRASRSVGANIAESWAKRKYPAHFVSKLSDADGELQETSHWLGTALACEYIKPAQQAAFQNQIENIGGMLGKMMQMPEKFIPKS